MIIELWASTCGPWRSGWEPSFITLHSLRNSTRIFISGPVHAMEGHASSLVPSRYLHRNSNVSLRRNQRYFAQRKQGNKQPRSGAIFLKQITQILSVKRECNSQALRFLLTFKRLKLKPSFWNLKIFYYFELNIIYFL